MKGTCVLCLALLWAGSSSQAQIVLTRHEIPSDPGIVNEYYVERGRSVPVDVGESGGPRVWDFSQGPTTDSEAEAIVAKGETPFGGEFPEANVVYDTDGINIAGIDTAAGYMYWRLEEGEMALLGAASENIFGVPLSIVLDSSLMSLPLPLEYGASWSDSTFYSNIFEDIVENPLYPIFSSDPYLDAKVEIGFVSRGEVDAWGTMIVPQGQYQVLRVRRHEVTRLDVSAFSGINFVSVLDSTQTVITYDWNAENVGPVAAVTSRPGETNPGFTVASRVRRLYRTNAISNRPPEISSAATATAFEDRLFSYIARATDPDNNPVSYSFAHYPMWLSPSDSTIMGTPGEGTLDTSFLVTATDGLLSDSLVVNVTVKAVNDPPIILPLPDTSFVSGDSVVLDLGGHVEDVDTPEWALTWSALTSTEAVIVTIGEGQAVLTAPDFEGTAEVFFTVTDDSLASDRDTVLVTVVSANVPPEIVSDSAVTAVEDEPFSYIGKATDPNGDSVTFFFSDYPGWLTPSDSVIAGTPVEGTADTGFVVIASDGLLSDSLGVRVTVLAVNDPPIILPLPDTSFVSGDSVVLDLNDYVEDVDTPESALTWSALTLVEAVSVEIEGAQSIIRAPDFEGIAEIIFTVTDDSLASDRDTILVTVFGPTAVLFDEGTTLPEETALLQNYPNPFNPQTDIEYRIRGRGYAVRTTLKVLNILGQELRTLVDESKEPGFYTVTWDGRDCDGNEVPSGVYYYVLRAGQEMHTKKGVLIK
ncbi:MAG: hypothetical protein JSV84_11055 [Gemmatimonadota bacterium]|nr:MAG: hypothetical protein JSV84_11055 [Gemmatimonadota bacterium]